MFKVPFRRPNFLISIVLLSSFNATHPAAGAEIADTAEIEESVPAGKPTAQKTDMLEVIVVTAEHIERSVRDVPATIDAFTGAQLAESGVQRPLDLARVTPGLTTYNGTSDGTPLFAIRGIGVDDPFPNATSGVASYIDDVGITSPAILGGLLFDVARVEVLKGPQGTLYGRNATGGAINYISNAPTETFGGYLDASYSRWGTTELNGAISGPVTDSLSLRLAGTYLRASEGWQTDIDTGRRIGAPDKYALRGTARYKPTERLTALLSVHISRDTSSLLSPQSDGNTGASSVLNTGSDNPSLVRLGSLNPHKDDIGAGFALNLTYHGDAINVTSISGFDQYHYVAIDNNDGQPGPSYDLSQNDRIEEIYQEIRLVPLSGLFGGRVDWLTGASYSRSRVRGEDSSDQSSSFVGQFETPPDFTTTGLSIAQANYIQIRESAGIYGNTETHITDQLSAAIGARYSHDRAEFNGISTEDGSDDGGILFHGIGANVASVDESHTNGNFSFKAGLNYKLNSDTLIYSSVSTAHKSGTYYAGPAQDPASWGYVPPEKVAAFELGEKAKLSDGHLQIDSAVFDNEYTDRQSLVTLISPVTHQIELSEGSVPKSRIRGFETEVSLLPITGLRLSGGASYLDSRVINTITNVRGAPLLAPVPEGSALPMAPKWSFLGRGSYTRSLSGEWVGYVAVDYSWKEKYKSALSDPHAINQSVPNLDARIEIRRPDKGLSLALWGRNLTNSSVIYYDFSDYYDGRTVYRTQPASIGLTASYAF
jgi:iron complex outermembrane receptor protein